MLYGKGCNCRTAESSNCYEHLDRLERSARAVSRSPKPHRGKKSSTKSNCAPAANKMRDGASYPAHTSRGGKDHIGYGPATQSERTDIDRAGGTQTASLHKNRTNLITSQDPPPAAGELDARIHHANLLNSILAKIEANNAGADDALKTSKTADSSLKRTRRTSSLCVTPTNPEQETSWQRAGLYRAPKE